MGSALGSPSFSKIISYLPNFADISRHTKADVLSDFDKDWKGWHEAEEEGPLEAELMEIFEVLEV